MYPHCSLCAHQHVQGQFYANVALPASLADENVVEHRPALCKHCSKIGTKAPVGGGLQQLGPNILVARRCVTNFS